MQLIVVDVLQCQSEASASVDAKESALVITTSLGLLITYHNPVSVAMNTKLLPRSARLIQTNMAANA